MSTKPPSPKTIKREQSAKAGRTVYVGRATCVKLRNGIEVILLTNSDENLQRVVDQLDLPLDADPNLDTRLNINAAICDVRDLDLEDDL
jgi:hypothetical protein